MHLSDGSNLLTLGEGSIQLSVLQHVQIFIGHKHLEGIDSFLLGQSLHLCLDLQRRKLVARQSKVWFLCVISYSCVHEYFPHLMISALWRYV